MITPFMARLLGVWLVWNLPFLRFATARVDTANDVVAALGLELARLVAGRYSLTQSITFYLSSETSGPPDY